MKYAVDTDILAHIQRAGIAPELIKLGRLPVILTDIVWDEFVEGPKRSGANQATIKQAEELAVAIAGSETAIMSGSAEASALARLTTPPMTEDLGELSIIAYASVHTADVAVLLDRKALHRAVEELGPRVISMYGFLKMLEAHGLARSCTNIVSQRLLKNFGFKPPLWW